MKKSKVLILAFIILAFISSNALASEYIRVNINGAPLYTDVSPVIVNGRTMVPVRPIFESLGMDPIWNGTTREVTATNGTTSIKLNINSRVAYANGEPKNLDQPPIIVEGRVLVPVRFIGESFNMNVRWDQNNRKVCMRTKVTSSDVLNEFSIVSDVSWDGVRKSKIDDLMTNLYQIIGPRPFKDKSELSRNDIVQILSLSSHVNDSRYLLNSSSINRAELSESGFSGYGFWYLFPEEEVAAFSQRYFDKKIDHGYVSSHPGFTWLTYIKYRDGLYSIGFEATGPGHVYYSVRNLYQTDTGNILAIIWEHPAENGFSEEEIFKINIKEGNIRPLIVELKESYSGFSIKSIREVSLD